ncbi:MULTISPECIES: TRAP transporter large permease [Roseobacteraceae]|uniref:TRAP transporter large permease protein n=1 Tax=Roseovarius azorensis TaxID=1287727 RepID=A0A1H7XYR8_9RHOB|nr:TRAP transporter large permease subunit [Roseovarius azorensis]SEM38099.1 TRAP transporter, DctM subunit [Roseovarius azorensis]
MELALWMFPALFVAIFIGVPVAFALLGVSLVFGFIRFGDAAVHQFIAEVQDLASNYVLAAVPLFILMGTLLESTGIAKQLFKAVHMWTRRLPGSLAVSTILLGTVFAAASGVVGATETVIGLLAIPVMLSHNYSKSLISGTVCGGGSLGTAIPPSVVVIVLAPSADVSVGSLFAAILFPGLMMAGLFILYIIVHATLDPRVAPRSLPDEDDDGMSLLGKLRFTLVAFLPPVLLIFSVLGTILLGWATPTEAAACGALGTLLLTATMGQFKLAVFWNAIKRSLLISVMILTILLGGHIFSGIFAASGGVSATREILDAANLSPWSIILLILLIGFIGGFILDLVSVVLIVIPLAIPIVNALGFDTIWFLVLFLIVLQTGYLTPPMAPSIFYLRSISPPEMLLKHMYRGVIPFIGMQLVTLVLVMAFPELALWLPEYIRGP